MDRVDRKKAMILLDSANAIVILSIPLVAQFGHLTVGWIYVVTFIQSTIFIAFSAGEFAAIPSLVSTDDLVTANGGTRRPSRRRRFRAAPRRRAPLGHAVDVGDVVRLRRRSPSPPCHLRSFARASTHRSTRRRRPARSCTTSVRASRYVLSHPVLRNISVMMALINFVGASTYAQDFVLFAETSAWTRANARSACSSPQAAPGVVVTGLPGRTSAEALRP